MQVFSTVNGCRSLGARRSGPKNEAARCGVISIEPLAERLRNDRTVWASAPSTAMATLATATAKTSRSTRQFQEGSRTDVKPHHRHPLAANTSGVLLICAQAWWRWPATRERTRCSSAWKEGRGSVATSWRPPSTVIRKAARCPLFSSRLSIDSDDRTAARSRTFPAHASTVVRSPWLSVTEKFGEPKRPLGHGSCRLQGRQRGYLTKELLIKNVDQRSQVLLD